MMITCKRWLKILGVTFQENPVMWLALDKIFSPQKISRELVKDVHWYILNQVVRKPDRSGEIVFAWLLHQMIQV